MFRQVGRDARRARPFQISGRTDQHALVVGQFRTHQRRIGQAGDADGHVDAFADQVDQAVVQVQRHGHVAVLGDKRGDQWRHVLAPEAGRCGNEQMAAGLHAALGHGRFRLFQFSQDALAIFQEGGAFIRQGQLARRALQ